MKKNIAILLTLTLIFSACTKTDEVKKEETSTVETSEATTTEQATTQTTTVEEVIEEIPENIIDVGENAGELIEMNEVLQSDDRLELTLLDIDLSHYPLNDLGPSCKLDVANKSDELILVGVESLAINEVEMPTVYEEIAVPAGENLSGILPLVSHHMMSDIIQMGKVWSMDIRLYARNEAKDYYEIIGPLSLDIDEKHTPYTVYQARNDWDIQVIGNGLYDNKKEIIIPFYYDGQNEGYTLVPKKVKIKGRDGEKEFKCVGYQKVGEYQRGFGEAFIIKDEVDGVYHIGEIEVEFEVKNAAGGDVSTASASTDYIEPINAK